MSNGANHNTSATPTDFLGRFCETPVQETASDFKLSPIQHIYVHIPFCARICPYCAFYKDLLDRSQTSRFCEALVRELVGRDRRAPRLRPSTIYFGGGTPTALNIAQLELLRCGFHEKLALSELVEWTVEASAGRGCARTAAVLRTFGVNEISLGVA